MIKRAIYIGDVRFNECPVFELNIVNGFYEMLGDTKFRYEKYIVEDIDDDFIVFDVDLVEDEVTISMEDRKIE